MRLYLRHLRVPAAALVLVGLFVQVAGAAGPSYADPVGDTSAADITRVTVESDASGLLLFTVRFANRSKRSLDPNDRMFIYVNTDRKRSTGDTYAPKPKHGADYYAYLTGTTQRYIVARLRGNKSTVLPKGTSKSRCCAGGVWEFAINAKEIGSPKVFDSYVHTKYEDPAKKRFDYAPDKGVHTYRLTKG